MREATESGQPGSTPIWASLKQNASRPFHALGSLISRWSARQGYALADRLGPMAGRVPLPDDHGLIAHTPKWESRG